MSPSQSLSRPSQISALASRASQPFQVPLGWQVSTPKQVARGLVRLQARVRPADTALHSQVLLWGMHWRRAPPSVTVERHTLPRGH